MNDPSILSAHDWNFPVLVAYGPGRLVDLLSAAGMQSAVFLRFNVPGIKKVRRLAEAMDCAERIAVKALKDSAAKTHPRSASLDEIRVLIETAIKKAR